MAGFVTGLGAATGDAVYASFGLFGVSELITVGGRTMMGIEVLGGWYLAWLGTQMLIRRVGAADVRGSHSVESVSVSRHFWRGLATDLSNPKTFPSGESRLESRG